MFGRDRDALQVRLVGVSPRGPLADPAEQQVEIGAPGRQADTAAMGRQAGRFAEQQAALRACHADPPSSSMFDQSGVVVVRIKSQQ